MTTRSSVAATDGVGTKLRIAIDTGSGGHDRYRPCRDVRERPCLPRGGKPLFFLDYFATGKLEVDAAARIVGGHRRGLPPVGVAR